MKPEEARALLQADKDDPIVNEEPNQIRKGLEILEKYCDSRGVCFEIGHGVIWAYPYKYYHCSFDELLEEMTEEDIKRLIALGWHEDDESPGWENGFK